MILRQLLLHFGGETLEKAVGNGHAVLMVQAGEYVGFIFVHFFLEAGFIYYDYGRRRRFKTVEIFFTIYPALCFPVFEI